MVAPCVVGVGTYFSATCVIDRNDIPLQILFEEVQGEIEAIRFPIFHANGRTACIVEINQQMLFCTDKPSLGNDLRTVEDVLMNNTVNSFTRSNAIFVVGIRVSISVKIQVVICIDTCSFTEYVACQLSAVPYQLNVTAIGFGIADLERISNTVIDDIGSVELRELVAPRAVTRWDSALEACTRCVFAGESVY